MLLSTIRAGGGNAGPNIKRVPLVCIPEEFSYDGKGISCSRLVIFIDHGKHPEMRFDLPSESANAIVWHRWQRQTSRNAKPMAYHDISDNKLNFKCVVTAHDAAIGRQY